MRVQLTAARRRGSGNRRTKLTRKIEEFIGKYSATVDLQGDARRFVRLSKLIYCFFFLLTLVAKLFLLLEMRRKSNNMKTFRRFTSLVRCVRLPLVKHENNNIAAVRTQSKNRFDMCEISQLNA